MSARVADFVYRFRYVLCGLILAGFVAFLPRTSFTDIDNELSMWISKQDPVYQQYERFREEFGGQRTLLIALKSDRLFTPESLQFLREVTGDIERVELVERVHSLASANVVRGLPATEDDEGGIEVQPLLREGPIDAAEAARAGQTAVADPLLSGEIGRAHV